MTSVLLVQTVVEHTVEVHWQGHRTTLIVPLVQQMTAPDVAQHGPISVSVQAGPAAQPVRLVQSNFTGQIGTCFSLGDG